MTEQNTLVEAKGIRVHPRDPMLLAGLPLRTGLTKGNPTPGRNRRWLA
jgi:hypothetical protein